MQISDTKEIVRLVALVDNRKVTPETIEAWHGIIGHIPFDIAKEALKLAQQDASIKYLEPRHIVSWVREAAFRLDRQKPKTEETFVKVPQPVCKAHNLPLMSCNPCCSLMGQQGHMTDAQLHLWAKQNIYA